MFLFFVRIKSLIAYMSGKNAIMQKCQTLMCGLVGSSLIMRKDPYNARV